MDKQLLFSVTKKDLDVQYFCTGGPGGQRQNKVASGCRIVHRDSGAVGESREERSQDQNRRKAFARLTTSKPFTSWVRMQASARMKGFADAEAQVIAQMQPEHIKIETFEASTPICSCRNGCKSATCDRL